MIHLRCAGLTMLLAVLGTAACLKVSGPSLGLFIGGFFVAACLAPATGLIYGSLPRSLLNFAAICIGIGGVWLIAVSQTADTFWQWLLLCLVLIAYALALAGIARAAEVILPSGLAFALAALFSLVWLTWPIWLSPELLNFDSRSLVHVLVALHPPLVANGILRAESPWTEYPLAYQLTNLNQDVPITLPTTPLPCIAAHFTIGILLLGISNLWRGSIYERASAANASRSN